MSDGIRSGVNWILFAFSPKTVPSVLTSSVFPRPGALSISTCPPASRAISIWSMTSSWPTTTSRTASRPRSSFLRPSFSPLVSVAVLAVVAPYAVWFMSPLVTRSSLIGILVRCEVAAHDLAVRGADRVLGERGLVRAVERAWGGEAQGRVAVQARGRDDLQLGGSPFSPFGVREGGQGGRLELQVEEAVSAGRRQRSPAAGRVAGAVRRAFRGASHVAAGRALAPQRRRRLGRRGVRVRLGVQDPAVEPFRHRGPAGGPRPRGAGRALLQPLRE